MNKVKYTTEPSTTDGLNGEFISIETAQQISDLKKENEMLREKLNCKEIYSKYMPDNLEFVILTKKDYERIESDYKSRNEKAIEYINENWGHWCSNHFKYATETINILQGVDKE